MNKLMQSYLNLIGYTNFFKPFCPDEIKNIVKGDSLICICVIDNGVIESIDSQVIRDKS